MLTTQTQTGPPHWPSGIPDAWGAVPHAPVLSTMVPHLRAGGDRPMVIFDDDTVLTCRDFLSATGRLAAGLATRVGPGDQVGIAIGNRAEYLIAYYAVMSLRAVVVQLGSKLGDAEAAHIVADRGLTLAIADGAAADVLERMPGGRVSVLRLDSSAPEPHGLDVHAATTERQLVDPDARTDDRISIGYTSGTTGLPKALAFTHDEPLRYADVFLRIDGLGENDRVLCPLQFHYGDPLWLLLVSVIRRTPLVVMRKFSVSRFWDVAARFEVTRVMSIGSIPSLLLKAEPSPAERAHRITAALAVGVPRAQHAELVARFGFPWVEHYAMSETCVAIALPEAYADRYVGTGALGIPVPEAQVRLVDPDGREMGGAAAGELEVTGPWVPFRGYLGNQEATDELLHDGWVRTGDLMRRDDDGVYYFQGRRKELIRRGGENIAPAQVEEVLRDHPAVLDAAVVPVPDPVRDEEVKAYIHVRTEVAPAELAEHCAARLAPHKVPRYIELRTEPFPRTPSQRIRKQLLTVDGEHRVEGVWDRLAPVSENGAVPDTSDTAPPSNTSEPEVTMAKDMSRVVTLEKIPQLVGSVHDGIPLRVSREQRDTFERVTLVHLAHPEALPEEFPRGIVEGFHTLSLIDAMTELARPFDPATTYGYNYGLDRVRWMSPVRIGDTLRSRFECTAVDPRGEGWVVHWHCTVTVEGADRPAMVADWLCYVLPRPDLLQGVGG